MDDQKKLLTIVFEAETENYLQSIAYRRIIGLQLRYGNQVRIEVSVPDKCLFDKEWLKKIDSEYVVCIKESHQYTTDYFSLLISHLLKHNVYAAVPKKYQGVIPKQYKNDSFDQQKLYLLETDVFGVAFNVDRLLAFLHSFADVDIHTLLINYRIFYSIVKLNPLNVGYSTNNNTIMLNGYMPEATRHLLLLPIPDRVGDEIRLQVLRLVVLFMKGLRTARSTSISLGEIDRIILDYDLIGDEIIGETLLTDRFEKAFLQYRMQPDIRVPFKELTDYRVDLKFSEEKLPTDDKLVLLYEFSFADAHIYAYKCYTSRTQLSNFEDLATPNFYLRSISEDSVFLFMDRATQADDNAEYLYEYFISHYPQYRNAYFAIHPKSDDWSRLKLKGFKLVPMWSKDFYEKFLAADVVISSQLYNLNYQGKNLSNSRSVYLQHGVILTEMHDWIISKFFDVFVTTGKIEAEYLKKMAPVETINAGLARYQDLKKNKHDGMNLLFMPTWRFDLNKLDDVGFKNSTYYKRIMSLLNNQKLNDYLEANNVTLEVKLHPNLNSRTHLFHSVGHIKFVSDSYRDLISRSDFAFTDYSSVVIDAAFIDVPIAYYQYDAEYFFDDQPYEQRVDYETEGLGPVFKQEDDLVSYIVDQQFLKHSLTFSERRQQFFEGVDQSKINQRIIERILSL